MQITATSYVKRLPFTKGVLCQAAMNPSMNSRVNDGSFFSRYLHMCSEAMNVPNVE